jgi:hypothetical protein
MFGSMFHLSFLRFPLPRQVAKRGRLACATSDFIATVRVRVESRLKTPRDGASTKDKAYARPGLDKPLDLGQS